MEKSRWLHTNGCGDFTLLARDDWFRLRGYPDWPIFSWHLDSVLMFAAHAQGLREVALGPAYRSYHIDHSVGSGWSLAGHNQLFARLDAKAIPYLSNEELHRWQLKFAEDPKNAIINGETGAWEIMLFRSGTFCHMMRRRRFAITQNFSYRLSTSEQGSIMEDAGQASYFWVTYK